MSERTRIRPAAVRLRFGEAEHGWLPATLELGGRTLTFDVSHLPYDFVGELVDALSGVLGGPGEYVARICEEPAEHDWRFHAPDPTAVAFEVVTYREGRAGRGVVVGAAWGAPLDIVRPLWRGLRELAGRARGEGYRSHWGRPFPYDALDQLTERLRRTGASPP